MNSVVLLAVLFLFGCIEAMYPREPSYHVLASSTSGSRGVWNPFRHRPMYSYQIARLDFTLTPKKGTKVKNTYLAAFITTNNIQEEDGHPSLTTGKGPYMDIILISSQTLSAYLVSTWILLNRTHEQIIDIMTVDGKAQTKFFQLESIQPFQVSESARKSNLIPYREKEAAIDFCRLDLKDNELAKHLDGQSAQLDFYYIVSDIPVLERGSFNLRLQLAVEQKEEAAMPISQLVTRTVA